MGCLVAPTVLPGSPSAPTIAGVSGVEIGGEIYYRVTVWGADFDVSEVSRLSDDAPVALFRSRTGRQPQGCDDIESAVQAPFLFNWAVIAVPPAPQGPIMTAVTGPSVSSTATWYVPPWPFPSAVPTTFTIDGGWGIIDGNSTVEVATTPGSSAFTVVYQGMAGQLEPVARGSLLVWNAWDAWSKQSRAHIRSWTQAGGTQVLVGGVPDYDIVHVALSDSKIVWMGGAGLGSVQGAYGGAALYWSPLATSPAGIQRHTGTGTLPYTQTATDRVVTSGDLAATSVGYYIDGGIAVHILVANLTTAQVWDIPSRPSGNIWRDVLAMNATTLLVQESTPKPPYDVVNLVRLDLTKLDSLVNGLQ
jgi:hypothetical protein